MFGSLTGYAGSGIAGYLWLDDPRLGPNDALLMHRNAGGGHLSNARRVFDGMLHRTVFASNALIGASASVVSAASALGRLGNMCNGKEIHGHVKKCGLDYELQVAGTLMDMHSKCGNLNYAEYFFKMSNKYCVSWTTDIVGYAQTSRHLDAFVLFREMQDQE